MANEILKRNPTSTGNRRVFTWAGWVKINKSNTIQNCIWFAASSGSSEFSVNIDGNGWINVYDYSSSAYQYQYVTNRKFKDYSSWFHLCISVDTTQFREDDRFKIYINGVLYNGSYYSTSENSGINYETRMNTPGEVNHIGQNIYGGANYSANCQLTDLFLVDGQALTPDVFGFNKPGKGYISAGTDQATDFRPGQWVPKSPRIIKSEINSRGGFGVNGFYLPMNSSNNFGADFHCEPNTILKLKSSLPQPKAEIDGVGDYTGALRDDPFKQYLVAAIPGVSGGLNDGFGDYSHIIRGNGTALSVATTNSPSISSDTSVYYGSSVKLIRSNSQDVVVTGFNNNIGTGDFTIEGWFRFDSRSEDFNAFNLNEGGTIKFFMQARIFGGPSDFHTRFVGTGNEYNSSAIGWNDSHLNNWYHYAVSRNSGTLRFFLNGVCVGVHLNHTENIGSVNTLRIGYMSGDGTKYLDGYFQDIRYYTVGKYTGGFDVPKPYTPVGIESWRAVPDTTANNFATLNPLVPSVFSSGDRSISNGNLTVTTISTGNGTNARSTIGMSSGKWYAETYVDGIYGFLSVRGIGREDNQLSSSGGDAINYWAGNGNKYDYDNGSLIISSYGSTYTTGDIIGISINADNGEVIFYKNGVSQGIAKIFPSSQYPLFIQIEDGASSTTVTFHMNFGQNPSFSGNTTAGTFTDSNGKGLFKYQPPIGFLALCEDNLPTPAISNPGEYFKTVLWTGDGTAGRSITGIGFQPDLVWLKSRTNTASHRLSDSVRGVNKQLMSNTTEIEATFTTMLTSFDSDGFTLGDNAGINGSGYTNVAWCWRAGAGTTSTNTDGSIQSVVSVNQDAGFSIVSYTGTGASNATVGHGLGKVPAFGVVKCRDTNSVSNSWRTQHKGLTSGYYLEGLANTSGQGLISATSFGSLGTFTSSSTVTLQAGTSDSTTTNESGKRYIMYLWAEIEGYSKFGSYVGNGNADGPFVYCGFKPAWVMIKRTDSTGNWVMHDNARNSTNPAKGYLLANSSGIEEAGSDILDFLSNGFKIRNTWTDINASGGTIIFAAFAESPFQTANAK